MTSPDRTASGRALRAGARVRSAASRRVYPLRIRIADSEENLVAVAGPGFAQRSADVARAEYADSHMVNLSSLF